MITKVIKINPESPEEEKIMEAANIIRKGGLVAFPTETVYGLGADALNPDAVKSIFKAKGRPADNPLIIHVSNLEQMEQVAKLNKISLKLIEKFFPGPIALVMKKKKIVPYITSGGLDKIAVRMPDNRVALKLIETSCPLAAPSANLSGKPSPTRAEHVIHDFNGKIDMIIDAGETRTGLESTVIDTTEFPVKVLRPGPVTLEMIKEVVSAETEKSISDKYAHYSTSAELVLVVGRKEKVPEAIREVLKGYKTSGKKVGIIAAKEPDIEARPACFIKIDRDSPLELAKNLFSYMRDMEGKVDVIIVEGIEETGFGYAIMDRLKKGADNVIKI